MNAVAARGGRLALAGLLAASRVPGPWVASAAAILATACLAAAILAPERLVQRTQPIRLPALVALAVLPASPAAVGAAVPWPLLAAALLALLPWACSPAAAGPLGGTSTWVQRSVVAAVLAAALLLPFAALRVLPLPTARLDELLGGGAWILTGAVLAGAIAAGALARHALARQPRTADEAPPEAAP